MNQDTNLAKAVEKKNYVLRLVMSLLMVLGGALVVSLTIGAIARGLVVVQQFGLALMIAGVISLLRVTIIDSIDSIEPFPTVTPIQQPGIKMIADERQGDWRYHVWVVVTSPQDLFFAGRSVLHRINTDLKDRGIQPLEEVLIRKVSEGSKIKLLFCDPTWDLIPQLAKQEAQSPEALYANLADTFGVVNRLWQKISTMKLKGRIEISLYKEHIQYAYHRTSDIKGQEVIMYTGFYFARRLGCRSPLFEVDDKDIQKVFEDHFDSVFKHATPLLTYPSNGQGKKLSQKLFLACKTLLADKIGADDVEKRIG